MITFTRNKPFMLKYFLKRLPKRLRFDISSKALRFVEFGLSITIGWSTKNNGID